MLHPDWNGQKFATALEFARADLVIVTRRFNNYSKNEGFSDYKSRAAFSDDFFYLLAAGRSGWLVGAAKRDLGT